MQLILVWRLFRSYLWNFSWNTWLYFGNSRISFLINSSMLKMRMRYYLVLKSQLKNKLRGPRWRKSHSDWFLARSEHGPPRQTADELFLWTCKDLREGTITFLLLSHDECKNVYYSIKKLFSVFRDYFWGWNFFRKATFRLVYPAASSWFVRRRRNQQLAGYCRSVTFLFSNWEKY